MLEDVQKQMYNASFRNIPFLFSSTERKGGRKTATHEYPNTNRRYVEDLGRVVPTFTITAVISGTSDYFFRRDQFIDALETEGAGLLSHPFYGTKNVVCTDYTLTEDIANLGKAMFQITFAETGKDIYPTKSIYGSAIVKAKTLTVIQGLTNYIQQNYTPTFNNKTTHQFNVGLINAITTSLLAGINRIKQLVSKQNNPDISIATDYIHSVDADKEYIAQDATKFSTMMQTGLDNMEAIDVDNASLYAGFAAMCLFRQDVNLPAATTIQRKKNLEQHYLVTGVYNIMILLYAYQQATEIEYFTIDDVDDVQTTLESQYKYILTIPNIDPDLLSQLRDVRTDMRTFFNNVGKQVYKVTSVYTDTLPLAVLTYSYYGELTILEELRQLNNVVEPSFVHGNIDLLVE